MNKDVKKPGVTKPAKAVKNDKAKKAESFLSKLFKRRGGSSR